jgi:hypothetical protein
MSLGKGGGSHVSVPLDQRPLFLKQSEQLEHWSTVIPRMGWSQIWTKKIKTLLLRIKTTTLATSNQPCSVRHPAVAGLYKTSGTTQRNIVLGSVKKCTGPYFSTPLMTVTHLDAFDSSHV